MGGDKRNERNNTGRDMNCNGGRLRNNKRNDERGEGRGERRPY